MSLRAVVLALIVAAPLPALAAKPIFPDVAPPEVFGRVVLDRTSTAAHVAPVVFEHWGHRVMFSCRLCHIDVGFAMAAGGSQISRATNSAGLHCGACHDGKKVIREKVVFAACSATGLLTAECVRCHVGTVGGEHRAEYFALVRKLPVYAGGYVDWEAAEAAGQVKPLDFVEGVSIARAPLKLDRDVPLVTRGTWLGTVTFSHKKHAAWNGCEVCHPDIFPSTKSGQVKFDMAAIREGRSCGACHRTVAFPLAHCQRCHVGRSFGVP
ncbi:MAG TPA: c(7)-type cytochrome triheme domain-containing protein [Anaeromyxobacter sp.]